MTGLTHVHLSHRGVLRVSGSDTRTFLQGLISNDVERVSETQAIHAAFLTPQGKYLHDFMVVQAGDAILLDCEAERMADLAKRLKMFKLRSDVTVEDVSDEMSVYVLPGAAAGDLELAADVGGAARQMNGGVLFQDPRLGALGGRALLPKAEADAALAALGSEAGSEADYEALRLQAGVPDGTRDLIVEKSILLESGFDELNGVDWDKGCYMGQELTARTKYRGLIKKRLIPVTIDGDSPEPGTALVLNGKEVGEMRSSTNGLGLALIRLEALETGEPFEANGAQLTAQKPDWAAF